MGFALRQTARKLRAVMDKVGPENVKWLIDNNKPLRDLPEVRAREAELRAKALKYRPLAEKISEEQFLHMLPLWCLQIVQDHGEAGTLWLQDQLRWLRQFFSGEV